MGWASIVAAIRLPLDRWIHPRDLRRAGGLALATLALGILGLPLPPPAALGVLVLGIFYAIVRRRRMVNEAVVTGSP